MASVPANLSPPRTRSISLTGGGAMVLALRLATAGAMFVLQIVLARALGVSGYGIYAFATACLQAMAVFGRAGLESTSLRQISEHRTKDEPHLLASFLTWSRRTSLIASLLAAAFLIACTFLLIPAEDALTRHCLLLGAVALPFLTTRQIQEARLRAVHHVWQSLIGPALWPTVLTALLLLTVFLLHREITASDAVALQIAALAVCSVLTWTFVRNSPLSEVAKEQSGKGAKAADSPLCSSAPLPLCPSRWRRTALTFLAFDAVILLRGRTSVIIAGMLIDTDTAGIFAAAERFAEVVTLGVASINMFAAPHFASLHAAGRRDELQALVRSSQSLGLLFAVPCAVALVIFGRPLLQLLDPGFVAGYPWLLIMLASVTIGSLAGPAAYVLAMSGRERTILNGAMLCMVVNLVLSFTLATLCGPTGLAITHLTTMIVWTIYMLWQLRIFQREP